MKAIFSLRKHSYLKLIGTVLIAVALIAGIVGCDGTTPTKYDLTMDQTPAGGGTATDETGSSPYAEGRDVSIKAVANTGYVFVSWTAPAGEFADENAAETTFTMPAQDVIVTANFEFVPVDHFKVYQWWYLIPPYVGEDVYLEDQFCSLNATVGYAGYFADPVEKVHDQVTTAIAHPDHNFMVYELTYEGEPREWEVTVSNQFGDNQKLTVSGPYALAVPTQVEGGEEPVGLDHYMLYEVVEADCGWTEDPIVSLKDGLINEPVDYEVWGPYYFGNPVRKTHGGNVTEIVNPDVHAVIYDVWSEPQQFETTVRVNNQFGELDFDIQQDEFSMLAVPSEKIDWAPVLDHFRLYAIDEGTQPYIGELVQLQDQFLEEPLDAVVEWGFGFCNPVDKWHNDVEYLAPDWNYHLTVYNMTYEEEPQAYQVTVSNQFVENQQLTVVGPLWLAVPSQELYPESWEWPEGLDHFLLYLVVDYTGQAPDVSVELEDQLRYEPEVWVEEPVLFANPVQKTYGEEVTEIQNPGWHIVFYNALGTPLDEPQMIEIDNQFGEQSFTETLVGGLGVPSQKLDWTLLS